jgi:lysozyme family protein
MITFEGTRQGYLNLWNQMAVRPDKVGPADKIVERILAHKADYEAIEKATGVPWVLVAGLHSRESDLDFDTYLGNGQSLHRVTTQVPAGRGPFASFVEGAIDALALDGLSAVKDWPIERVAFMAERFNGEGYFTVGINSPYLWSWSNLYSSGKFVRDHSFSHSEADPQCGVMVLIKRLAGVDAAVAERLKMGPHDPLPPQKPKPVEAPTPIFQQTEGHTMVDITAIEKEVNVGLDIAEKMLPMLSFIFGPQVTALLSAAIKGARTIESAIDGGTSAAVVAATAHLTPGAPNSQALGG